MVVVNDRVDLLFSPGQQYPSGPDSLCQYRSIACTVEKHGERRQCTYDHAYDERRVNKKQLVVKLVAKVDMR